MFLNKIENLILRMKRNIYFAVRIEILKKSNGRRIWLQNKNTPSTYYTKKL